MNCKERQVEAHVKGDYNECTLSVRVTQRTRRGLNGPFYQ